MPVTTRKCPPRTVALAIVALLVTTMAAGEAFAQGTGRNETLKSATETAKKIQSATGAKAPDTKVPSGDPCAIVSLAEVQKAFPGAKGGERNRRLEQYGITECAWKTANGTVVLGVQESYSPGTAKEDAEGMAQGFTDPLKPQSLRNVRLELITIPGVQAVAFVERADPQRGILGDGAMLAMRQGDHTVSLMSASLSARDRAAALKVLEDLGKTAAKRLQQ